jgi:chlorobactene glucosyltransferase
VIIPARDEERAIEATVRGFLAQTYPSLEVIAVDDRSADATGAILARLAAEDARLTVVTTEEPPEGWLGKPAALHQGSLHAKGELLLFADADISYAPEAVASAVAFLQRSGVALITLLPHFELRGFWEHVAMPQLAVSLFAFLPVGIGNRTRIPLFGVGGGTGNLVRRADYDASGGHVALRDAVIDDVGLARLLRRHGRRTIAVRADRLVTVRMYHGLGEIIRGFTKNMFAVLGRSYLLAAFAAVMWLAGHLLPFALAAMGNPLALATVGVITLIRLILYSTFRYGLLNALLGHPLMTGVFLVILARSVWFTGIRRQLDWRGRRYDAARTRFGSD